MADYAYYIAGILAALVACVIKVRQLKKEAREDREARAYLRFGKSAEASASLQNSRDQEPLKRAMQEVPVPWGWPGSKTFEGRRHAHSGSGRNGEASGHGTLQHWVDKLVSEKKIAHDEAYRRHLDASMRALLEDRFHSPGRTNEAKNKTN